MIGLHAEIEIKSLIPLSGTHLRCACLCANRCKEIEQEFIDENTTIDENDLCQEDIAYATGAVISSIAFLESSINEFFQDFFHDFDNLKVNKLDSLMNLKQTWDENNETILWYKLDKKYEITYKEILGKTSYKNSKTYDRFKNLIYLRNLLVHFKAKWQTTDPKEDNQYRIKHLRKQFKENTFMEKTGNSYFPKKCLGAGCAEWSIIVSTEFLAMFSNELSCYDIDLQLRTNVNKILQQYSFKTN
ncbi:hypothetical protein MSLAZ_1710 [Methanosarcina lacustris Z-7289]|uniref:Uncharacterized protein n=1 Tax=Methanosarcina lacustris Z-7289 TaxID=1434111 RepID=A0A0E3S417_9EURY|nr:hypothetical protein [Methanosarcina lacustris]AKB74971.1 hypothetical protein MSLAZ_1710 [Methanosarcina lacustris Z-7289]